MIQMKMVKKDRDSMTAPQRFDIEWTRGTTPTFVVRFKRNGVALSFSDARFTVNSGKKFLFRLTIEGNNGIEHTDVENGEITIRPTAKQTRMLTETKEDGVARNKYEIELRNGADEEVFLMGNISGIGGINDDEEIS